MMRIAAVLSMLALLCPCAQAAGQSSLPQTAACPAVCNAEREACRAEANAATVDDTHPGLFMNRNSNPNARATAPVRMSSELLRPTDAAAFRARRAERLAACAAPHRRCIDACPAPMSMTQPTS